MLSPPQPASPVADLSPYKVDHLFLLIGENPLPNCVAALTLLNPGGQAYLVHTTHTRHQAERIDQLLRTHPGLERSQFVYLGDYQAEAYQICQQITSAAQFLQGSIGMNYTGGTKAMAVHAYRTLSRICPESIFSYLDPHRLEMCIDNDTGNSIRIHIAPSLSLAQIFNLHGLSWRKEQAPRSTPLHAVAAAELARLYSQEAIAQTWREWCNRILRPATRNATHYWQAEPILQQVPPLSLTNLPAALKTFLQDHFAASSTAFSLTTATQQTGFPSVQALCEWLDGTWLEHYVLQQIQAIAPTCDIHDSQMSFHIRDPKRPDSCWDKFEFDVAFIRHYQLFALSCTTTKNRSLCKQKLIEASVRARQLGGAEARIALVCAHPYTDALRSELEVATRDRKLAVFGPQDFTTLAPKIKTWIQHNA